MNCPTCDFEIAQAVHFCPHCGWPAAKLTVEVPGNVLAVPQSGEASVQLLIRNVGAGFAEYSLRIADGQPWARLLSPGGQRTSSVRERRLAPGRVDNSLRIVVSGPDVAPGADQVAIEVESSDQGGDSEEDLRPWDVTAHRWRPWEIHVPMRRLGEAEIHVARTLVIFTTRQREARTRIENVGGSTAAVSVEGLPPNVYASWEEPSSDEGDDEVIEITFEEDAPEAVAYTSSGQEPQTIPSGSATVLVLRADDEFEGLAEARVCSPEGGEHQLVLYGEPTEREASLVKHWTLGIDFGTAKSAVYYTDNWVSVEQRQPQPILWPPGPTAPDRTMTTTRSAVMFQAHSNVPLCGHQVLVSAGAEGEDELVIESIKTQLRGEAQARAVRLPGDKQATPVELVASFMRYLLEEVRASDPFRGKVDMDARLVLTVPVMKDQEAFLTQRENTLLAASEAGMPVDELLTPGEPECAALDLMHSLRRGDYTFDDKAYHLQNNEIILVFDCGAGTTDVAALRVVLADGKFGAEQMAGAGYPFGGDVVDDLLLSWLLDQRADELRLGWSDRGPMVQLEGLSQPIPLHAAREECRRLKESLFVPGAEDRPREFHTDLGTFEVSPAHVERLIVRFLETIFTVGIMPDPRPFFKDLDALLDDQLRDALWREMIKTARTQVRPLEQVLREAHVQRSDVTFLFITGGTGQIPIIASRLYEFMGRSARIVVARPEDCTVNVARGASLYYDYQISGVLRCAIDIVGRDPDTGEELFREQACTPGALPGPELERAVRVGPRQEVVIALAATYPSGGPSGDIARQTVRNPAAQPRQLIIHTEFDSDHTLYWAAAFADGQVVVAREPVMQV